MMKDHAEAELWEAYQAEGRTSKETVLTFYRDWIVSEAKHHFYSIKPKGIELSDFIQHAMVATLESIDRFDINKSVSFKTYAKPRIRGEIINSMGNYSEQQSIVRRAHFERHDLFDGDGDDLFKTILDMVTGYALNILYHDYYQRFYTLDDPSSLVKDEELTQDILKRAIATLPDMEQKVVEYHYSCGLNFSQVAKLLGVSKGRVSQVFKSALQHLIEYFSSNYKRQDFL
ncbi:sigma-70 family RNA polymerase sigma factor [Pleionea sp. CnH1-48]|uniref:sigma-70 family RNA polymerase sigma factor n=1 Tax=Pleionea sp. CnH1-48 TaxID=2954494 RepID=UPI0020975C1B|nr:sigma-70 family RNA polymerase sigma factor [Pleionea sp. CnH1-48]MCO7223701.1 sigma-70 family RNA polymerase sigma factor [Pleionea sp. CnH1-48]